MAQTPTKMINNNPSAALFFITKKNEEEEKDFEAGINGLRFQEMIHEASKSCAMSFYTVNRQDKFNESESSGEFFATLQPCRSIVNHTHEFSPNRYSGIILERPKIRVMIWHFRCRLHVQN